MKRWIIFLPALCLYPLWITIGFRENLFAAISIYYPMMLAMVIGSMIAGATPLGGGIVAFPVSVLILGFTPPQGRDFSLLIQSVGMTAASFLILYKKQLLLAECGDLMGKLVFMSVIGLIVGFELLGTVSPYIMNIVYTTTVVCIVIIFIYQDFINDRLKHKPDSEPNENASEEIIHLDDGCVENGADNFVENGADDFTTSSPKVSKEEKRSAFILNYFALPLFGIAGGILSSQIGSGADIACYLYGSFANTLLPRNIGQTQMSNNSLTAMSVIVMASTSVFGSVLRLSSQLDPSMEVSEEALSVLFACAPVVVLGAPIGSLLLTPPNQQRLKYAFYMLGILQLFVFGVIKIWSDVKAWAAIAGAISAVAGSLLLHFTISGRKQTKDEND